MQGAGGVNLEPGLQPGLFFAEKSSHKEKLEQLYLVFCDLMFSIKRDRRGIF